jgi:hypothetical protein
MKSKDWQKKHNEKQLKDVGKILLHFSNKFKRKSIITEIVIMQP